MWSPQWAARATGKGTVVVVLGHNFSLRLILWVCLLFTIFYSPGKQITRLKKVLIGGIYPAKKPAKMPSKPDNNYSHGFQSEANDWTAHLKFVA
jgi:hypothetical protein